MPSEKKKLNPQTVMGISSGVGYVIITGIKVYTFGWEDVQPYWIWAGGGLAAAMIAVFVFHRGRERRALRERITRSAGRLPDRAAAHTQD